MGTPVPAERVKYFASVLSGRLDALESALVAVREHLGEIESVGPAHRWNFSPAYQRELGPEIHRRMLVFDGLATPEALADWKQAAMRVETSFESGSAGPLHRRLINLDPGYLNGSQVVLASTKRFANRVYLRDGIYADLTLWYNGRSFEPLRPLTLPDYRTRAAVRFFNELRRQYLRELSESSLDASQRAAWKREYRGLPTYSSTQAAQPSPALDVLFRVATSAGRPPGENVLDVGCGRGRNTLAFAQRGHRVYAIDVCRSAVEECRQRIAEAGLASSVEVGCGDILKSGALRPESFDLVADVTTINSVVVATALHRYLSVLGRLCAPTGLVFMASIDPADEYLAELQRSHREGMWVRDPHNGILGRAVEDDEVAAAERVSRLVRLAHGTYPGQTVIDGREFQRHYAYWLWGRATGS